MECVSELVCCKKGSVRLNNGCEQIITSSPRVNNQLTHEGDLPGCS